MSAYVPVSIRRAIRERFANRCAYCRTAEDMTATQFEIEHIRPRADGGETALANLCLSCPMCNRVKSDATSAIDSITGADVPLFHPQKQRWDDHFGWSDDATEVAGLSAVGRATVVALRMNRPAMVRVRRVWIAAAVHPPV